jgi:hypothetical protein
MHRNFRFSMMIVYTSCLYSQYLLRPFHCRETTLLLIIELSRILLSSLFPRVHQACHLALSPIFVAKMHTTVSFVTGRISYSGSHNVDVHTKK